MADDGTAQARSLAGVSIFTAEVAAAICARVAAGESLMALGRDPAMPHRATIRKWANGNPAFSARLMEAMRAGRFEKRRLDREVAAAKAARPKPAKGGSESSYAEAVGEAICRRLANGESLIAICRDADMPCYGTVYGWLKRHPDFADAYVQARAVQADYLFDAAREVSLAATPKTVWAERLRFDAIRWMTARMAPKKYCERVVVEAERAAMRAEAATGGKAPRLRISITDFQRAPDGKTVLAAPPRDEREEQAWIDAYGHPYDGPR
jgi:FAD/FMN-containing dehydrogenase